MQEIREKGRRGLSLQKIPPQKERSKSKLSWTSRRHTKLNKSRRARNASSKVKQKKATHALLAKVQEWPRRAWECTWQWQNESHKSCRTDREEQSDISLTLYGENHKNKSLLRQE